MRALIVLLLLSIAPVSNAKWFTVNRQLDDQILRIELWQRSDEQGNRLLKLAETEAERIHQLISPLVAKSEVSMLNRVAAHKPIAVSSELYSILQLAESWAVDTEGSFDITQTGAGQLDPIIDYKYLITEPPNNVRFLNHRLHLDITPLASGYLVDKISNMLKEQRVRSAWIQYGQAVKVIGSRHGQPWSIDIANRQDMLSERYAFPLLNSAVATAGAIGVVSEQNSRRVEPDRLREQHNRSDKSGLIGVIALAYDGIDAAIYANSIMSLGKEAGLKQVNELENVEAILIDRFHTFHYSKGLR